MKSILQAMFGKLSSFFSVEKTSTSENILGTDSELFEKSGSNNFMVAYVSTLMNSIFGFFQKNTASLFGLSKLSTMNRIRVNALGVLTVFLFFGGSVFGQTAYVMSGSNYSQNFSDIANWTNNFAAGVGASNFSSVGIIGSGNSVTTGVRTTKSSATFVTGSSGGIQKGTQALQFLSTGSSATPEAVAVDLFLDFTGRNAGTLSFDWSAIDNSSGTRPTSLRVFWSTDGTTFTEISAAQIIDQVSTASGSITTVALPSNFNNAATARLRFYNHAGNATGSGSRDKMQIDNISVTSTAASSATITGAATATAFTTTYGTPSTAQTFAISGSGLTANITATAPTGFEVSSDGTTYGATATFTQSGGNASGSLSIRLQANAAVTGSYNSQNIVLSTIGATNVNIATAASGNSVTPAALTIAGVNSTNKVYNASVLGSLTGSASYSGLQNSESFSVTGTPVATFAQATVGTGIAVTVTGYAAPSTNYTVSQPTVANADITAKPITISGLAGVNKAFDGNTTATLSGTASLVGVETVDIPNVIVGGTYTATFASAAVGNGIAITVTGYSISGSASGNYSVSQPAGLTANITAAAPPTISATGTLVAVNTTYGTASVTPTSFSVSGSDLTNDITIIPPAGYEVSTTIGSGYANSLVLIQTSGTVNATTIYVRLNATATVAESPYTGNVTLTSSGATTINVATASSTVSPLAITITGATASNKTYDRTTAATITGATTSGAVNGDSLAISGGGTFASANFGTSIAVTTALTLSGTNATSYTIIQPTGLTANIDALALTITGAVAQNKVFDGTTTATITGTLAGVIAPDVVTLTLSGTFASSAVGTGIAVTSTSTIGGADAANYTLTQPSGLTANITIAPTTLAAGDIAVIGYNTNGSPDNFAILVLKDLNAGTVFYVNDNEVASAGGTAFSDLAEMEASFTVKAGQTIPAGTVIVLPWGAAAVSTTTYDWSSTSGAGLGNNNEEIYIYTAASITATTPTAFIFYAKIGTSSSAIPLGLTLGSTSIAPTGSALRYATTGATYTACQSVLLSAIGNTTTNWNTTGATTLAAGDWTFNVLAVCSTLSAPGTLTAFTTTYGTPSAIQTVSVSGSGLTADISVTAPTGFEVSNGGAYGATTTFTQSGGTASGTLSIRLAASAAVTGTYNNQNIALTSTGATAVNLATTASGNSVSAKALTISVSANNKEYDGNASATLTTPSYIGLENGETFSVTGTVTASFADKNVGTAKPISLTGTYATPSTNYTVTQPTLTANIDAKDLTVTGISANNKVYDGTTSATLSATLNGVVAPDNVQLVATGDFDNNYQTITIAMPATIVSSSFTLTGTAGDITNYNLIQPTVGTLTADITPKALTISNPTAANKTFDGTTNAVISGTLVGVVLGDSVNLDLSTGVFASPNVGTNIVVTPTWILDGDTYNYTLTEPSVTLTANITTPGSPNITSSLTASATYGDTSTLYSITTDIAASSYGATGLPGGLSINTATGEITGAPTTAGTFTVSLSATGFGGTGFATLVYTIAPKTLTVPSATANNKVYDGNTSATISGTLVGVINSDDVTFNGVGTFDSFAVANSIAVTSNATLTGANASNYTLTQPTGLAANITPKPLSVTFSVTDKVYDKTNTATVTSPILSGVVGLDTVTVPTFSGTFNTVTAGNSKPVTVTGITLGGANAGNYSIPATATATGNITPKPLTVTASANNKQFDGTNVATITVSAVTGVVLVPTPDIVTVSGGGTFASTAIGNAISVTPNLVLGGADAANYTLTQPTGLTANITDTIIYVNAFTGVSACPTNGNTPTMIANATGTPVTRNTITCTGAVNVFNSTTLNATAAVNNNSYVEFSATATAGNKLSVTSLSFFRQASNSAPNQLEVRYSTDGFATSTPWGAAPSIPTAGSVITWDFIDFTTPTAGTVTFRLYPYGTARADGTAQAASASGTFRVDDVTIYGKVLTGPTAAVLSLTGSASLCSGTSSSIKVDITGGTPPYTVAYTSGSVSSYASGTNITVTPATTTTYTITSVTDANGIVLTSNLTGSATVTVTAQPIWYLDADGDGYITATPTTQTSCTQPAATLPALYRLQGNVIGFGVNFDCNDAVATINPGRTEICWNNIDDDCDGLFSEGCAPVVVNMATANSTVLPSFATAVSAQPYTFAGATTATYRFTIVNNQSLESQEVTSPTRFVTIPESMRNFNVSYTVTAAAVIDGENVPYAGNTITVLSPIVPKIKLTSSSCNVTLTSLSTNISSTVGTNAISYTFRARLTSDNGPTPTYYFVTSPSRFVNLASFVGLVPQFGTSYTIDVQYTFLDIAASSAPTLSGYGDACTVTTPSIPLIRLSSPTCGTTVSRTANIAAASAFSAIEYQFRIRLTSDNGPSPMYYYTVPSVSRFSNLASFQGLTVQFSTSYSVSVQYKLVNNGTELWSGYGSDCVLNTQIFPTTEVTPSLCGLPTTALTQSLTIVPVSGATIYRVSLFEQVDENLVQVGTPINRTVANFTLSMFTGATVNKNYVVTVSVQLGGVFGPEGRGCDISTFVARRAQVAFGAIAYPNPFASGFNLDVTTSVDSTPIAIKVYDMVGRLIEQHTAQVNELETMTIGDRYPSGVYNVTVTQGEETRTVRVVKR